MSESARILVVDDETELSEAVAETLGYIRRFLEA